MKREQDKVQSLEIIFNQALNGECDIWTSSLTLVETNKLKNDNEENKGTKPWGDKDEETIRAFFDQECIKVVQVTSEIAHRARLLYRQTEGLNKRWDAIHLATAQKHNIATIHTYDRSDMLHLNSKLYCVDGTALTITKPVIDAEDLLSSSDS